MNILLLSRYGRRGASSRLRFYQYIPYLEQHGAAVTVAPLLDDAYLENAYAGRRKKPLAIIAAYLRRLARLLAARRFDLVWLEYELFPWLPAWGEALLAGLSVPYLVDYDDAIFHYYDLHRRAPVRRLLGGKIDAVMRRARVVVAGNDYLAEHARRAGAPRVAVLPTVVDLARYNDHDHAAPAQNDIFTIGWIGTPYTAKYLYLVRDALLEVRRAGDARLVCVGSGPVELEDVPVEVRAWAEDTEAADIQGFDVGIMPLDDSPWERGKSGYKLIQYMACARPVVASPVGVNAQIVADGVNGFHARSAADWVRALTALRDAGLRARMGAAGRARVEAEYCLQVTAPALLALLHEAAGR